MHPQILFVDFSSDNSVRIAHAEAGQRPPRSALYHCHSLAELDDALRDFLEKAASPELMGAAFSICGWERDGAFEMPNLSYRIERNWIKDRLNISRLNMVNDCVAAALAIDRLQVSERIKICPGNDDPSQMKALIALGRGLGTTCIFSDELGNPLAVPCAGGHSDLPATTDREYEVVRLLTQKYGRASRVRAVSNYGLVNVLTCLQILDGNLVEPAEPSEIVRLARQGHSLPQEAVKMVLAWLAATASDTALSVGARGGIFLAGSFFDLIGDLFDPYAFAERFHDKGRLKAYLEDMPVYRIQTDEPEMLGLSTLFGR